MVIGPLLIVIQMVAIALIVFSTAVALGVWTGFGVAPFLVGWPAFPKSFGLPLAGVYGLDPRRGGALSRVPEGEPSRVLAELPLRAVAVR
jgi:hypothetical protein